MDVDQPLVGADLEVLTRVLVLEGRADHAVDVLVRGQGDGPGDSRPGALRRLDDLAGSAIDGVVVVRLETDPDLVCGNRCQFLALCFCVLIAQMGRRPVLVGRRPWVLCPYTPELTPGSIRAGLAAGPRGRYSRISVTTPEPTVRPPSRMANRTPLSMAIGLMSSIVISTLSPGITISVPSGRFETPVTSVVRK